MTLKKGESRKKETLVHSLERRWEGSARRIVTVLHESFEGIAPTIEVIHSLVPDMGKVSPNDDWPYIVSGSCTSSALHVAVYSCFHNFHADPERVFFTVYHSFWSSKL